MRVSKIAMALLALVTFSSAAEARKAPCRLPGCHGPGDIGWERQSYMTGFGEYRGCMFHRTPDGDPPMIIDWAARNYQPIVSPQQKIHRREAR
jgi:hypothetical protein